MIAAAGQCGKAVERWRDGVHLLRLVAHPARLAILSLLCEHAHCVKELVERLPLTQPQISQHMAALREAGLVEAHSEGTLRYYYILRPKLTCGLLRLLQGEYPEQPRSRTAIMRERRRAGCGSAVKERA